MLDIGWSELILIGVVALIVVGPRDLPEMFRTLGRFTAKARSMARDFSRVMEDAARETGVSDIAKDLRETTSAKSLGLDAVKNAATKFEKWDPLKGAKAAAAPVASTASASAATAVTPAAASPEAAVPPAAMTAAPAVKPALGPATQAQADANAQRAAVAREAADKLRAVSAPAEPAKPAKKPRAVKAASSAASEAGPVAKPRAAKAAKPAAAASAPEAPAARPRGRVRKKPESEA